MFPTEIDNLDSLLQELEGNSNRALNYAQARAIVAAMRRTYSYAETIAALIPSGTVTMTQAEAAAAIIAGDLTAGTHLIITEINGKVGCEFRTTAKSSTEIEKWGTGTYINDLMATAMEVEMGYDIDSDLIFFIYEPINNNELKQSIGVDTFGKYPLDALDVPSGLHWFKNNVMSNVTGTWDCRYACFIGVTATDCAIDITSGAGPNNDVLVEGATFYSGAIVWFETDVLAYTYAAVGGLLWGAFFSGIAKRACTLTVSKAAINGTIGEAKILATDSMQAGYAGSGIYENGISTFEVSAAQEVVLNPEASGTVNMSVCPFVGKIYISDVTAAAGAFLDIIGMPSDHKVKFTLAAASAGGDWTAADSAPNFRLGDATRILKAGWSDWIELEVSQVVPGTIIETGYYGYTNP